ncbi:hypothetical protein SAMN02983003_4050 [Devosia enhydra]|uniref:YCII-related domain-containing protein n=1 Tax=Devosia enhydra TaxID=665118 RepID=A0A1K2I3P9_9HYPH|nr:YciI family protein [Devosia enhydra]SFZ86855.1 hypothetical protein SAMN02983003_4050 [Devosia enhydra]
MPYFCVHAIDRPGRLADRQRLRESHRARLRVHDHPVVVRIGGPLLGDDGEMMGSMLVIEAATRTAVEAYLAGDPYVVEDLFASVTISGFNWGLGQPEPSHG